MRSGLKDMSYYDDFQKEIPSKKFVKLMPNQLFKGKFLKKVKVTDTFGDTAHWYFEVLEDYAYDRKDKDDNIIKEVAKAGEEIIINKKYRNKGKDGSLVATRFFIGMKENEVLPGDEISIIQSGKGFETNYGFTVLSQGPEHEEKDEDEEESEDESAQ